MNKSIDQRIEEERKLARHSWRRILLILALIPILIGVITFSMNRGMGNQERNFLYRQTESGWQPIDGLPGSPEQIEISPAGIVWVKTSFSSGLSRFDGSRWQHFNGDDFGTRQNYVDFVLVGEEVWAANEGGVFHFADGYWRAIPQSPKNDQIEAVVASRDSFWMIDTKRQLSYFDGFQWRSDDLSTFLPNREWFFNIMLLATPDETLWLNKEGRLWHFNGQAWQEFFLEDQADGSIRLLNQTSDAFWVEAGGRLTALTFAGKEKQRLDIREMGLTTEVAIQQVTMHKGSLWVATNEGLLTFDGQQWQQLAPPSPELPLFRDVTLAPDGTLWTINRKSAGMLEIVWDIVQLLLISVVGIVLVLAGWKLNMRWFTSSIEAIHKQEAERSKEVSSRLLLDMPVEEKQLLPAEEEPLAKIKLLDLIPELLLWLALFWFLRKPIEDALEGVLPYFNIEASTFILVGFYVSFLLIIKPARQTWLLPQKEEGESLSWKESLFLMVKIWFLIFLVIFLFGGLSWLIENYNLPSWIIFFPIFLAPVFLALLTSPSLLLLWWSWRAAQKGDYEQAFRRLRFYERFTDNTDKEPDLLTLEGKLLFLVGRYEEAQELFDQVLREKHNRTNKFDSDMLNDLSTTLLELGRYEEATEALESSIIMNASQVVAYNCLAEVYLYQGTNLKEARKLTERGLQNHEEGSLLLRMVGKGELIETLAIHAWVLAELGLHHEAAEALERAFAVAPRNHKLLLAALHLRAGYVSLRRGDHDQAKQHFTTGQELDPKGHYGRLAGVALAKM